MKTILVLTNFSAHAKHGAAYALQLAKKLKADLLLCNTFLVPAEMPMAGMSVWPQQEYAVLSEESSSELGLLKKYLQDRENSHKDAGFHPNITINSAEGNISDIVKSLGGGIDIRLAVAGTHDKAGFNDFLLGNSMNRIIDNINFPLLLVPPSAAVDKPIKKIVFATDLVFLDNDEKSFYQLVNFARALNSEILVAHIFNGANDKVESEKRIKDLLAAISNKADHPHIYYRIVNEKVPEKGLTWLCENGQVDVLAMVHQNHNFLDRVFGSSHTQKMAERTGIPLLVLPTRS